jgi:hypothetical protein
MKPNALDSAVVAVLCCVLTPGSQAWVERPPRSASVDVALVLSLRFGVRSVWRALLSRLLSGTN